MHLILGTTGNEWFKQKLDVDLGLSHDTWPRFGYQGANPNSNFEPHTDQHDITDVWAKGLIYLHDTVGTKMYESELITHKDFIDPEGNTVSKPCSGTLLRGKKRIQRI